MDNLIYRREIRLCSGLYQSGPHTGAGGAFHRRTSWGDGLSTRIEYNTPDDKYARVITEERMPALK